MFKKILLTQTTVIPLSKYKQIHKILWSLIKTRKKLLNIAQTTSLFEQKNNSITKIKQSGLNHKVLFQNSVIETNNNNNTCKHIGVNMINNLFIFYLVFGSQLGVTITI